MIDRLSVFLKFEGRCAYCGNIVQYKDMQVDHVMPKYRGGSDDMENLFPTCRRCNHYKRAKTVEEFRLAISSIPQKLMERNYIFKVGVDYGFFDPTPKDVKFYFEKVLQDDIDYEDIDYEMAVDYQQYCEMYEQTYNTEDGSM